MEASVLRLHLENECTTIQRRGATASPFRAQRPLRTRARTLTRLRGGRKRAAPKGRALDGGGNPNQVYGQPYRGFESLPLRCFSCPRLGGCARPEADAGAQFMRDLRFMLPPNRCEKP